MNKKSGAGRRTHLEAAGVDPASPPSSGGPRSRRGKHTSRSVSEAAPIRQRQVPPIHSGVSQVWRKRIPGTHAAYRNYGLPASCLLLAVLVTTTVGCKTKSNTEKIRRQTDPIALSLLIEAQQFFESGFYNNSLVLADSARSLAPRLADIPFLEGRVFAAIGQYDLAREAYDDVLALDAQYPGVYLNLGNIEYLRGQPEAALALYRKETAAAGSVDYLVQLGRAYADLGKTDSARVTYEKAIATDPSNPTSYMWLGQLLEDEGSLDEALAQSRKGLALRPANMNYAYVVGVQLLRNEDLPAAAEMLQRVTEEIPWHYAAHYNLGQALQGLGETERARRYLARADTLLAYRQEVSRWEDLLSANSNQPMLWVNYGNALRESGRIDEAIHALSVAYSLNPEWLELQNNIANLQLARGDTIQALNRYKGLLAVDSTLTDIWLNLGTVYAISSDYDSARIAWKTALRHDPEHTEAQEYLARLPPL